MGIGCTTTPHCYKPPQQQYLQYQNCYVSNEYCAPDKKECSQPKVWVDYFLMDNFQFGWRQQEDRFGTARLSGIPQWMILSCPEETAPQSLGTKIGCEFTIDGEEGTWQKYVRVEGFMAYDYIMNCKTGEKRQGGQWDWSIKDCAISSVDADKLTNFCKLFEKVTVPIDTYYNPATQMATSNFTEYPVALTKDCKLAVMLDCNKVVACVVPKLRAPNGEQLWTYNPATGEVTNMDASQLDCYINVCIDGTTIRADGEAGATKGGAGNRPGGKILTSHTYGNTNIFEGDGTPGNPLDIKGDSIGGEKIKDGAITTEKIADDAVTSDKIAMCPGLAPVLFNLTDTTHAVEFAPKTGTNLLTVKAKSVNGNGLNKDNGGVNNRAGSEYVVSFTITTPQIDCPDEYDLLYLAVSGMGLSTNTFSRILSHSGRLNTTTSGASTFRFGVPPDRAGFANFQNARTSDAEYGDSQAPDAHGSSFWRLPPGRDVAFEIQLAASCPNNVSTWNEITTPVFYPSGGIPVGYLWNRVYSNLTLLGKIAKA